MNGSVLNDRKSHYDTLLGEILSGVMKREVLPSPSYDFAEERQARYYTNMRWNMESDTAVMVMKNHQQNPELRFLKEWRNNESK